MKNKKGVSVMIGYVLLIAAAVVMGTIVYSTLKTYAPSDIPACPGEASMFISSISCGSQRNITINLKNNGRFDLAGYYIYISNETNAEIADFDLASNILKGGIAAGGAVMLVTGSDNPISPGEEISSTFSLTGFKGNITLIEIIPTRFQEINNKLNFASCGNAKIQERLTGCSIENCVDTDGGNNLESAGTCINSTGYYDDECDDDDITEYYCYSGTCLPSPKQCVGQSTCSGSPGECSVQIA